VRQLIAARGECNLSYKKKRNSQNSPPEVCICHRNDKADGYREEEMNTQAEGQNAKTECTSHGSAFGFLVAGLGIGAVVSVFLAPQSGVETRKWIATKCLDGVEAANVKVQQVRLRVHELADQGQQKVSAAVAARREAIGKPKVEAKPV
jgi:gas vesicle protein